MIFRLFAIFILISLSIYTYQDVELKLMVLKSNLNLVLTKVNETKKVAKEAVDNTKKNLEDMNQQVQNGKSQALKTLTYTLSEASKAGVLGIKALQVVEITNLKIDYSQKEITVALNPLQIENIKSLPDFFMIKVFVTELKSDKSSIEDKYMTLNTEIISNKLLFRIEEGDPLRIYYISNKEDKPDSLIINPALKVNLPSGVYKGSYTARLYVETD